MSLNPAIAPNTASREGCSGPSFDAPLHQDLNSLLAQEQTAIMSAEAATSIAGRDGHRAEARLVRQLVDRTPYPDRVPHDFDWDPDVNLGNVDRELGSSIERVERNECALARQLAAGLVSLTTFQRRSRVLRQDRDRLRAVLGQQERFS